MIICNLYFVQSVVTCYSLKIEILSLIMVYTHIKQINCNKLLMRSIIKIKTTYIIIQQIFTFNNERCFLLTKYIKNVQVYFFRGQNFMRNVYNIYILFFSLYIYIQHFIYYMVKDWNNDILCRIPCIDDIWHIIERWKIQHEWGNFLLT